MPSTGTGSSSTTVLPSLRPDTTFIGSLHLQHPANVLSTRKPTLRTHNLAEPFAATTAGTPLRLFVLGAAGSYLIPDPLLKLPEGLSLRALPALAIDIPADP